MSETEALQQIKDLCDASVADAERSATEHLERTGFPDVYTPLLFVDDVREILAQVEKRH